MEDIEIEAALASGEMIDQYLNMIPARYYIAEDGVARKGELTTDAVAAENRIKKKKKKSVVHSISKNQLHEKLRAKIEEMKKSRQADPDREGKKGRRHGKRVQNEDVSFANVVREAEATQFEEGKAGSKRRNLEKNIRNLERQNNKVEKIADVAERTEAQQNIRMEKALQRAQGGKIRDNVPKLKKTLKNKEKRKERGKQAWKERLNEEKSKNEAKQIKRKENIQKYRTKKGKGQKGFEGQAGFLNKDTET